MTPCLVWCKTAASCLVLTWGASPEPDLSHYNVRRGDTQQIVHATTLTTWTAPVDLGSVALCVTAVDYDGNESEPLCREGGPRMEWDFPCGGLAERPPAGCPTRVCGR